MSHRHSMLRVIEETSKAVRTGPIELRRAVEVAESRRRDEPKDADTRAGKRKR
jgi:hypothetical protein